MGALVAELSGAFVRASVGSIDREIARWLKHLVLALELDRSTVYQVGPDGVASVRHHWARPGLQATPKLTNLQKIAPWAAAKVLSGKVLQFSSLDEFPPEAARDREAYRRAGNKSSLTVPIKVGKSVVGAVAFGTLRHERSWPPEVVQRLELIAQIFGFALERKRAYAEALRLHKNWSRSARLASMAELAASLAHELSAPLSAILDSAQSAERLLAGEKLDPGRIKEALHDIIQNDKQAAKMIGDVQRLFKRARRAKSPLDLSKRLNELEHILRSDAAIRDVALRFEDEALLAPISGVAEGSGKLQVAHNDPDHLKRLHGSLTPRERQVFRLVAEGLPNKQVASQLGIAEKTVKVHRGRVMEKMKAESLAGLVRMAARLGV